MFGEFPPLKIFFYYEVGTRLELNLNSLLSFSWLSLSDMEVGFLEKLDIGKSLDIGFRTLVV